MYFNLSEMSNSELPNSLKDKFEEFENDGEFIINDNIFKKVSGIVSPCLVL